MKMVVVFIMFIYDITIKCSMAGHNDLSFTAVT